MKKKIEKLRRDGRLEGNLAFEALWDEYQTTETAFEQAKTDRKIARSTYQFELDAEGRDEVRRDKIFELDMAALRADGYRQIRRADFHLAKYRLRRWVEAFAKLPEAAPAKPAKSPKTKSAKPKDGPASTKKPRAKKAETPAKAGKPKAAAVAKPRRKTKTAG